MPVKKFKQKSYSGKAVKSKTEAAAHKDQQSRPLTSSPGFIPTTQSTPLINYISFIYPIKVIYFQVIGVRNKPRELMLGMMVN